MEIVELESDAIALVDLDGTRRQVDVSLIDEPAVGQFVIIHAGMAIARLDVEEANERLALFEELAEAMRSEPTPRS